MNKTVTFSILVFLFQYSTKSAGGIFEQISSFSSTKLSGLSPPGLTLVTSLVDIGWGGWNTNFSRSYDDYLAYMRHVRNLMSTSLPFWMHELQMLLDACAAGSGSFETTRGACAKVRWSINLTHKACANESERTTAIIMMKKIRRVVNVHVLFHWIFQTLLAGLIVRVNLLTF